MAGCRCPPGCLIKLVYELANHGYSGVSSGKKEEMVLAAESAPEEEEV